VICPVLTVNLGLMSPDPRKVAPPPGTATQHRKRPLKQSAPASSTLVKRRAVVTYPLGTCPLAARHGRLVLQGCQPPVLKARRGGIKIAGQCAAAIQGCTIITSALITAIPGLSRAGDGPLQTHRQDLQLTGVTWDLAPVHRVDGPPGEGRLNDVFGDVITDSRGAQTGP
jgi:hypothetical protein